MINMSCDTIDIMVQNCWLPDGLLLDDFGLSFFSFAGGLSEMHIYVFSYVYYN